jgi:hypothetical protein
MSLNRKKISQMFITIFIIVLAVFFVAKYFIINKIETYIDNLPSHIDLKYDDVDVHIFPGSLNLEKVILTIKGQTTDEINAKIEFEAIDINSLSYLDYVFKDDIAIESVKLWQPKIAYFHNEMVKKGSYNSIFKNTLRKSIRIDEIDISNADIEILNIENDSLIFSTEHLNLKLTFVESNTTEPNGLPFAFKDISITSENLNYAIGELDNLFVASLNIDSQNADFFDVKLKTKYSRTELSKHLKTERDHFDLSMASVEIQKYDYDVDTSNTASFDADKILFNKPVFHIYRDKLIADDLTHKSLYSKMLRDLSFDLNLKEVVINKAEITYEEKVKNDSEAGKLEFSNLEATITNVANTYSESEQTAISITSNFMKDTPLKVDWNFDVNNVNDAFLFKSDIGMLKAEHLNQFMKPNLNLKLEGELIKTYFTIDGNANTSQIDLKTDYEQFDIIILKENGEEKNKFLSGLINLFIAENSKDDNQRFRESDIKTVERDKTKSIFNFIWKNAKSGLVSAMAGDGKKED